MMTFVRTLACAAMLAGVLAGCGDDPEPATETEMFAELSRFQADQQAWRDRRREGLLTPDGWASLIGLHWLEKGAHYVGSDADNGIQLALGPEHLGMLELGSGGMRLVPEPGVEVTVDGAPATDPTPIRSDEDPAGASVIGFDGERGQATVIERGGRHALRVRHADAPSRTGFSALEYWPGGLEWQVPARFVPHPPGQAIEVANIVGGLESMPNPGVVEFERDGATYRLEAIDEGGDELFLVFADRTSGQGSYGAGRFLYVPKPDADGRLQVDFNRSYNPPCAFTPFATCPLPPDGNRLDLAITAGEKAYQRPDS